MRRETYADGGTRVVTRNADGSLCSVTGTAVTPEYHFHSAANLAAADGAPRGCRVEEVRYGRPDSPRFARTYTDGFGDVVREERSGANGATLVTESEYDRRGRLVRRRETGRPETRYAYDDWGELTNRVEFADGAWRSVSTVGANATLGDGEMWTVSETVLACSDAAVAPLVTTRRTRLSGLSLATNAVTVATDVRGNKTYEGGATYPVRYTYDAYGNKTTMTTYRHEPEGGGRGATALPDAGEVVGRGDPSAPPGDMTTGDTTVGRGDLSAPPGDTTIWLYDEASGVMTNKLYADGKGPRYTYTDDGKLATRTWARGIITTYAYDGWNNLVETAYSDGTPTVTLFYDALGRQVEAHDAAGVTTFAYDAYGANTNEAVIGVAGTNVLERFTDAYGRDAGYALNGVRQTILGYDEHTGRLATMQTSTQEVDNHHSTTTTSNYNSFVWTYHPGSDLKSQLAYPNGLTASWTYDANNQLLQVQNVYPTDGLGRDGRPLPSAGIISQYDYNYDAAGRRIACTLSGDAMSVADTIAYAYNARGELTNAISNVDSNYAYSHSTTTSAIASLRANAARTRPMRRMNSTNTQTSSAAPPRDEERPAFRL